MTLNFIAAMKEAFCSCCYCLESIPEDFSSHLLVWV